MEKISAIIITLNEERNIARCLNSIHGVADEIIVIDSHSTDQTANICSQFDVRFETIEWQGFSASKNYGNEIASYDYILSLDADEALSPELRESILKEKKMFAYDAYRFNRLTNYCGKWIRHSGWYPDPKIRLWNRRIGSWTGEIHESVSLDQDSRISNLKGDLLHYSFYSIDEHLRQISRFTSIKAESWHRQGRSTNLWWLCWSPFSKFIRDFIFRGGFRDGIHGLLICTNSAHSRFIFQSKLWMLARKNTQEKL